VKSQHKKHKTLLLTAKDIQKLMSHKDAIKAVSRAFASYARNQYLMPSKIYLDIRKYNGDFRAMPAWDTQHDLVSLKWVNAYPDNPRKGYPAIMALVILSDAKNGHPLAVMDGTILTNLRTGAGGGVAVKHLSRKNVHSLALIGCGHQAYAQFSSIREVRPIQTVTLWDISQKAMSNLSHRLKRFSVQVRLAKNIQDAISYADVIVTTTPSRKPIIKYPWVRPGTHINAIGADAPGKQELDPVLLKHAKVIVDSWDQASHSGEINVPVRKKTLSKKNIFAALGDIVIGKKKGRTNQKEITVFDSTGLAIQDGAVGRLIYNKAKEKKIGKYIQFLNIAL